MSFSLWKLLSAFFAVWIVWLPITFWFGRIFCRWVCPLGLCQSLVQRLLHPSSAVRRVCTELPRSRVQRSVNWILVAVYFLSPLGYLLNPWGIFGRAVFVFFVPGLVGLGLVLTLALLGQGRIWCNWICPLGTLFDLVARLGWHRDAIRSRCRNCRRCFVRGGETAQAKDSAGGVERRDVLRGVAVLAVAEKLTDGGFAPVSSPGEPRRNRPVLPPGAGSASAFSRACIGCNVCARVCPERIIRPSAAWDRLGQPELDFRSGHCLLGCVRCSEVCPVAALSPAPLNRPLTHDVKPHVHLGRALWHRARCVRETTGDACTACVRKCPVQAIHLVAGYPVVDESACIGCGACEHVCPARPLPAIEVEGYERQRMATPLSEEDLIEEMRALIAGGKTLVIARDGVIREAQTERGLAPLLAALDAGRLRGAVVFDKVVGRAAAAIYAEGKARRVIALLAGEGAAEICHAAGVRLEAGKTVPRILNRAKEASCPVEAAIEKLTGNEKIVAAVRAVLQRLATQGKNQ